ncbi:MAG: PilZ domain-containing protein [Candidatus Omnitrophica bacterium]|nr:PilZ domain-containing protein [Candidatus Omnitrophota bacterium]
MLGNNYKDNERRKYPRLNVVVVTCSSEEGSSLEKVCVTRNISAGGICLILDKKREVNTTLSLKINLPDSSPSIIAKGRVVWSKSIILNSNEVLYDLGIEFIDIEEDARQRIFRYTLSHLDMKPI